MSMHQYESARQQDDGYASHGDHRLAMMEIELSNRIDQFSHSVDDPQDVGQLVTRYRQFEAMTMHMVEALDRLSRTRRVMNNPMDF